MVKPRVRLNPGNTLAGTRLLAGAAMGNAVMAENLFDGVNLVELTAVVEVQFLRLSKRAKHLVHGEQLQRLEGGGVLFQHRG
jgi:hypothetical protein